MKTLDGIRVLDLTQIYQGPYCAFLMAMAGADVVKVEPPAGERLRRGGGTETPLGFATLNSNKRSIQMDLKLPQHRDLFKTMVAKADVVLENYAPGVMDRFGLGYDVLNEINPRLIYGTATGYGITGPDKDQLAMDHTIQAACGLMSVTGELGGPPARAGGTPSDLMGGVHLYAGIMEALYAREKSGKGTLVEVAMQEAMYFTLTSEFTYLQQRGELPPRRGDRTNTVTTPYNRFECKDGWVAILAVAETHWDRILEVIGREDLKGNPDYESNPKRLEREAEINAMIGAWTATQTQDSCFQIMRDKKIPIAPVRTLDVVREDRHMHERGALKHMQHPYLGDIVLPASPIRMSAFERDDLELYPEPDADRDNVLREWLDMSDSEIEKIERVSTMT